MTNTATPDRFYFYSFVVMAILCLGGFVPSFFLRPQFFTNTLPVWVHIHGIFFTLWYLVAILQAWLLLRNKRALHRELGVIAALIVFGALILTYVAIAYLTATGQHVTGGAKFNLILTTAFTFCVAVGVYFRKKPDVHKRLMLMATALLTIPGFDRLLRNIFQPSFPDFTTLDVQKLVLFFGAVYIGFMIYRDVKHFGRPTFGIPLGFVCIGAGGLSGALFVDTVIWTAMVESLGTPTVVHSGTSH